MLLMCQFHKLFCHGAVKCYDSSYKLFQRLSHRPPCPLHVSVEMEVPAILMTTWLCACKTYFQNLQPGVENELKGTKTVQSSRPVILIIIRFKKQTKY